ncbi:MAG TPA: protein kinase, partial [Bacillota bacterium]|nr:protein kinase [Bacillota bacterium]
GSNPLFENRAASIAMDQPGIHRARIIHRDLAARNLPVQSASTPKISDFGLSRLAVQARTQGDFHLAHRFSLEIDGFRKLLDRGEAGDCIELLLTAQSGERPYHKTGHISLLR